MSEPLGLARLDAWTRRRPEVLDGTLAVGLALVVLPVSASAVWRSDWPAAARAAVVGSLVVGHLAVAARRRAPVAAFAVVAALMLLLVLLPDLGGETAETYGAALPPVLLPTGLVFPVVSYSVAAWCVGRTSWLPLAVGAVGAALVTVRLWGSPALRTTGGGLPEGLLVLVAMTAAALAPWALGRFRAVRAQYVAALEERARREDEDRQRVADEARRAERVRIAREMHDVVAHSLSVIVSQAEGGRMMAARDPARVVPVLETVARTGQGAIRDMRGLLDLLDDPGSPDEEVEQPGLAHLGSLVERVRGSGLAVRLEERGAPVPLGAAGELAAYRVVQESLTNVLKHAGRAAVVDVELEWRADGALRVEVRNRGGTRAGEADGAADGADGAEGAEGAEGAASPGRGLTGMAERVRLLGGRLEAGPTGAGAFRVVAVLPAAGGPPPG